MTRQRMVELLEIEKECVRRNGCGECNRACHICDLLQDDTELHEMYEEVIALVKSQEPRVMTAEDFIDNPDADSEGFLPVWVEYRRDGEWADYWDDQQDEWSTADGISSDGYRLWTARPTEEQMKAAPWP